MEPTPRELPARPARPRLYVVALSHLDTQWRWTVRETAGAYLPRTVRENEDRFRRSPHYLLNFEGAYRYLLLAECHPALFEILRVRVAEGRWFPSGAAWEAFDTILPAPESIVRQILYGTRYLELAVGKAGRDLFLPDCFGFSQALPTLAVHCGIVGFSTQKLRRGAEMRSAFGVPFPFGLWVGPDGSALPAVLDPGEYGAQASFDLGADRRWLRRFAELAAGGRPQRLMTYQGLGDKGGAISPSAIRWLDRARGAEGAIEVLLADSEQIFRELEPAARQRLPVYDGELLLRLHATGCYSSRSQLKRWHRKAELLAHATERASVIAHSLGAMAPDRERLRNAWLRILAHEMHDDLTGTCLAEAYRYSANDLALSMNEMVQELEQAVAAVASTLDTATPGRPLVVFNALGWERSDLVDVELPGGELSAAPAVFDAAGKELPSQWRREGDTLHGCFSAQLPALGFAVYDLRPAESVSPLSADNPEVGDGWLENALLRVEIDGNGDVARILDKRGARELLAAPIGLEVFDNTSVRFPSWEIRYEDTAQPPRARLCGPVRASVSERGAARVALTLERVLEGSGFVQTISLAAGAAGGEVVIDTRVDWRTDAALLKMAFRLTTSAEQALFDQGVGVARRPVASAQLYEVPAQQWAALRDRTGAGAAIANDCKYGWDHPAADTLRLTLLHTPRIGRRFRYQAQQDFGRHEVRVAIAPIHAGESIAATVRFAERLNQPLRAFEIPRCGPDTHLRSAPRRKSFSFLALDREEIAVQALKLAEEGDEVILRLRECAGERQTVELRTDLPLRSTREVGGCERGLESAPRPLADARKASVKGFGLSALALSFEPPLASLLPHPPRPATLALEWNLFGVTSGGEPARGGGLDGRGHAIPRGLLPRSIARGGVLFDLAHAHRVGSPGALLCSGQRLAIPAGFSRLALLAAAFPDALAADFLVDGIRRARRVAGGFAALGRFDELERGLFGRRTGGVVPGFLHEEPVALAVAHRHDRRGAIDPCRPVLFYALDLAVAPTGSEVVLPSVSRLVVLAAALADAAAPAARSASPSGLLWSARRFAAPSKEDAGTVEHSEDLELLDPPDAVVLPPGEPKP